MRSGLLVAVFSALLFAGSGEALAADSGVAVRWVDGSDYPDYVAVVAAPNLDDAAAVRVRTPPEDEGSTQPARLEPCEGPCQDLPLRLSVVLDVSENNLVDAPAMADALIAAVRELPSTASISLTTHPPIPRLSDAWLAPEGLNATAFSSLSQADLGDPGAAGEALMRALDERPTPAASRWALLYVGDGRGGTEDLAAVATRAQRLHVPIHVLPMGFAPDLAGLKALADATGGSHVGSLDDAVADVAGRWGHALKVGVKEATRFKLVRFRAPSLVGSNDRFSVGIGDPPTHWGEGRLTEAPGWISWFLAWFLPWGLAVFLAVLLLGWLILRPREPAPLADRREPLGWILVLNGVQQGERLPFFSSTVRLGRGENCDVVLQDRTAHRDHAELSVDPRRPTVELRDLSGRSGSTRANDQTVLGLGRFIGFADVIRLGATEIQVDLADERDRGRHGDARGRSDRDYGDDRTLL